MKQHSIAANWVHSMDANSIGPSLFGALKSRQYHDETQLSLDESWPTSLQLDFAELEKRVMAIYTDPLNKQRAQFAARLRSLDKNLYYKWLYQGCLTNTERDTIHCIANGVRAESK
ncbi:hypothetical protein [Pseudomonas phage Alpheus]|uniref:Uncharacterized protein n=1 Tax=Pseudomonas phage Alpheus TaxID=2163983 RepID=A0A2S1GMX3_9CAUD|nr:hypothetical protein HOT11_gp05 [Pseudomonas phage Alpheus]AWD90729.1 hypothetical protein [Pseudomonas phage Alpheus]